MSSCPFSFIPWCGRGFTRGLPASPPVTCFYYIRTLALSSRRIGGEAVIGIVASSIPKYYRRELFGGMSIQAEAWVTDYALFGSPAIQPDRRPYSKAHAPYLHPIRVGEGASTDAGRHIIGVFRSMPSHASVRTMGHQNLDCWSPHGSQRVLGYGGSVLRPNCRFRLSESFERVNPASDVLILDRLIGKYKSCMFMSV